VAANRFSGKESSARSDIREYREVFYSHQRRHSRLGNQAPAAFAKTHELEATT